jgi:hypothetical protein
MEMARALLDLQEHDLALMRLGKQLDEMPEKRAILEARAKIVEITKLKERTDAVVGGCAASMPRRRSWRTRSRV